MITEGYNILRQVDPVAKACMPVYMEVFVTSLDYGPTFNNQIRIFYNMLYRLDKVWDNSFKINYLANFLLSHTMPDGTTPNTIQDTIANSRVLGGLLGTQFKMMYYSRKLDNATEALYAYPDSEVVLEEVVFDKLDYPTYNLTQKWPDYVYY